MPLPPANARQLSHHRQIDVKGYQRDDGLWDIDAHMTDQKPFTFANKDRGGFIVAGDYLHDMWLRITVDKKMIIHQCYASIDSSPFAMCPQINQQFSKLKGIQIAPGWSRKVRKITGGINGCTHLNELLKPIATVAFQTIYGGQYASKNKDNSETRKPPFLNTCHTFDDASQVVKDFWPQYYKRPNGEG